MVIPAIDRKVIHMQVKACFMLPVLLGNYQRQRDCIASEKSAGESRFKFGQFSHLTQDIFEAGWVGGGQRSETDDG